MTPLSPDFIPLHAILAWPVGIDPAVKAVLRVKRIGHCGGGNQRRRHFSCNVEESSGHLHLSHSTAMTSPDELRRSVDRLRDVLESLGSEGTSIAVDLTLLDRLVQRYPAAARKSLELHEGKRFSRSAVLRPRSYQGKE
ncbi:hypothetical protein AB0L00_37485 [Actinoallomurus sp. NPDC052308]|uniref:hypothetical protein n=1 Tax=Actinoallomurus sp. NPDC052308 TaxID=3155530 RepID=UPI003419E1C1